MAKNILQDIVPPEKRSIRNIPVPSRKERSESSRSKPKIDAMRSAPQRPNDEAYEEVHTTTPPPHYAVNSTTEDRPHIYSYEEFASSSKRFQGKGIWVACITALIIVAFAYLSLSSGATIKITPRLTEVSASTTTFSAHNQSAAGDGVAFQTVTITKDMGLSAPATGSKEVDTKASGQITIYNNVSKASQKLVANTRFETSEGLIYRITSAVTVPGQTVSGGQSVPGSLTVTVTADQAGSNYNIGLEDFTLPGFASDPSRAKNFYARSKTAMTGGSSGVVKSVSPDDLATTNSQLRSSLNDALSKEIAAQIPQGYVYFPDGLFTTFSDLPQSDPTDSSVTLNERGTMTAVIFSGSDLAAYLAQNLAPQLNGGSITVSNAATLPFTIENKDGFDPTKNATFGFAIVGPVDFVGSVNSTTLAQSLASKDKSSIQSVIDQNPGILKIDAMVKPFWKHTFPKDPKSITIQILPAEAK